MTKKNEKIDKRVNFFDLPLFSKSSVQLLELLDQKIINSRKTTYIFTPNPEQAVLAEKTPEFLKVLSQADILLPDGIGLVWAAQLLKNRTAFSGLRQRISGREVVPMLLHLAQKHHLRVLLVGGRNLAGGVCDGWQVKASTDFTTTKQTSLAFEPLIWWTPGYQDKLQPTPQEEHELTELLATIKPHIVFVALGAPDQEYWLVQHQALLEKHHVSIAMSVGGSFDVLTGKLALPPRWISAIGLEWFYRLLQEPWRWKRQLALMTFIRLVIKRSYSSP